MKAPRSTDRAAAVRRTGSLAVRFSVALALVVSLAACGGVAGRLAGAALGGGPKVAANVQAGRTNAQVLGSAKISDQRLEGVSARQVEQSSGETGVRAEAVQSVTVRNDAPPWVWLVAMLAVAVAAVSLTDEISGRLWARHRKKRGGKC